MRFFEQQWIAQGTITKQEEMANLQTTTVGKDGL